MEVLPGIFVLGMLLFALARAFLVTGRNNAPTGDPKRSRSAPFVGGGFDGGGGGCDGGGGGC